MPDVGEIARRIKDENLLWLLAMWILAIGAGIRDQFTFIAVLLVGAILIGFRFLKTEQGLPLGIDFEETEPREIQLSACRYELRRQDNVLKGQGQMAFSFDVRNWVCFLPRGMAATDIIWIYLTDRSGQTWETGPFRPLFNVREVSKSQ
jgi:hypothetical protein